MAKVKKTIPINQLIDSVVKPVEKPSKGTSGFPFITHEGVLEVGDKKLRCYILSNDMRILDAEDVDKFFNIEKEKNDS